MSLLDFCKQLPKIELHAHLNGSISCETMEVLLQKHSKKHQETNSLAVPKMKDIVIEKGEQRKLDSAFEAFKLIHSVVDDEEAIALAACDVVKEFYEDNVKYLELRTTPRPNTDTGMTRESYVEAVLRGINNSMQLIPHGDMTVRLLLSVDRRQNISDAHETLQLAHKYSLLEHQTQGRVVGLDLSGYPKAGNTDELVTILREAKKLGLKLSVHMAERHDTDSDSEGLLSVGIDRIGHATFLHRGPNGVDSPLVKHVINHKIPVELCMTSNIKARTVESYDQHQFKFWNDRNHPLILCTDDKGVFATTLSEEYFIAAETFELSKNCLTRLAKDSIDYVFEGQDCKSTLMSFHYKK